MTVRKNMAVLQQVSGALPRPVHEVSQGGTTIGRHDECHIVVQVPAVSRRHARITYSDNQFFIEDLGSRNGTHVNGEPVQQVTVLNDGDRITISQVTFTFLTDKSLTGLSGSWGMHPDVISISQTIGSKSQSIRRETVQPGAVLTPEQLEAGELDDSKIVAGIDVYDSSGGWPVTLNAPEKLNHALRLLHVLRRCVKRQEIISHVLEMLFDIFPSGEHIAVVLGTDVQEDLQVVAAVSREETSEIEIFLPLNRMAMQQTRALLYVDHLRSKPDDSPDDAPRTMRSMMVVPLTGQGGTCAGTIQIDTQNRHQPLSRGELEKLVIVGHVVSCGLDQVQAFEATSQTSDNSGDGIHSEPPGAEAETQHK